VDRQLKILQLWLRSVDQVRACLADDRDAVRSIGGHPWSVISGVVSHGAHSAKLS
jgi:hypothetical protein